MIRPLIGWICAIWAHSCATQNVWRHIVPYYRRWILFSSIFIWFTLSCSGCASDSFWISELSFGQTSGLCTCGFPPTQHWITFAALRAICGLQYEGLVTLYIIIIKGNQTHLNDFQQPSPFRSMNKSLSVQYILSLFRFRRV